MWLRKVVLEVTVTLIILIATVPELDWARWIVIVYTPLILLVKIVALVSVGVVRSLSVADQGVPAWFWHANYGANVALLAADRWWILAAAWALIWILSIAYWRRIYGTWGTPRASRTMQPRP